MRENCIYRRLARCMAMLPATAADMAEATGMRRDTVRDWMRWLRADGVVSPGTRTRADGIVWQHGTGRGFPMSGTPAPDSVRLFSALWRALERRRTAVELSRAIGVDRRSANRMVAMMRAEGAARIAAWQMSGQTLVPIYDRLPAADAPKPQRVPREDSNARYWAKRRERLAQVGLSTRDKLPAELRVRGVMPCQ